MPIIDPDVCRRDASVEIACSVGGQPRYPRSMRRESRLLKTKAIASLRRAARAFNDLDDEGRVTSTLLHAQHALEMLLKAALREKGVRVFDKATGRSIGFDWS